MAAIDDLRDARTAYEAAQAAVESARQTLVQANLASKEAGQALEHQKAVFIAEALGEPPPPRPLTAAEQAAQRRADEERDAAARQLRRQLISVPDFER